jgi:hypothetical protein
VADQPIPSRPPALQFSILYDNLATDPLGKPVLIGPYDEIRSNAPPPLNYVLLISNQWTNGQGAWRQHIEISDPNGAQFAASQETEFYLMSRATAARIDERFLAALHIPGRYTIRIFRNNDQVLEYFFAVRFPTENVGTDPGSA